jgi:photosynthetic reaction center cytochrome c subunit
MIRAAIAKLFSVRLLAAGLAAMALAGCGERPPIETKQLGYRGTGMQQNVNPRLEAVKLAANRAPEAQPPASPDGPKAGDVYQNVQVLGDLSVGEFTRLMVSITAWVSPEQGCTYCHAGGNFADDSLYTKVVARKMVQMTQTINSKWQSHVAQTGVTCFTCHRGNPVPTNVWYQPADRKYTENSIMGDLAGQNYASKSVGLSSLPFDPLTPYLLEDKPIRVNGNEALKFTGEAANNKSTKQAEHTYALMIHMSQSLGANCTTCHNTQNFQEWTNAPPQRVTAWHGIRMARDINNAHIVPLTDTFPANRKGVHGDVAKVSCATCHQGVQKPLYGAAMAKDYPELLTLSAPFIKTPAVIEPAAATTGAASLPGKVLFEVGQDGLNNAARQVIADAAKLLGGQPGTKVSLSGFADKTGNPDKNLELAKQRAFAVRDALKAAGVSEDRIELTKPEFVVGGLASDARRVEISAATP